MNNIEFIDKNIEKCKELINDIENTSDELKGLYDEEEIIKAKTEMKEHVIEQLKQFEEIKNIIEAWEVVQDIVEIKRGEFLDHVLRIKKGKGALDHDEYKKLNRVGLK